MRVAVVVAGIEKLALFALQEGEQKLEDHRTDQCDECCLKLRREPCGNGLKSITNRRNIAVGSQGDAERADGGAQADHRADESKHGNRPQEAMHQAVTRRDMLFIVISLITIFIGAMANQ